MDVLQKENMIIIETDLRKRQNYNILCTISFILSISICIYNLIVYFTNIPSIKYFANIYLFILSIINLLFIITAKNYSLKNNFIGAIQTVIFVITNIILYILPIISLIFLINSVNDFLPLVLLYPFGRPAITSNFRFSAGKSTI